MPVQRIGSDIEEKVSKCDACAADLTRKSAYVVLVQRISTSTAVGGSCGALVKRTFSLIVSVLPRREHALIENQLGEVALIDFTVTLHLQCNFTDGGTCLLPNTPLPHAKA